MEGKGDIIIGHPRLITIGEIMLSLRELRRATRIVREMVSDSELRRITQPSEHQIVLTLEGATGKSHLLLSSRPEFARISLADAPESVAASGSFWQYARAHLAGNTLSAVEVSGENRQVAFHLQGHSGSYQLIFSIMGARSNIYLLDGEGKVVHSVRPLDETRNELSLGGPWIEPRGSAPSEGLDRWEDVSDSQYLEAIADTYCQLEQKYEAEALAHRIENAIKKERAFLERKLGNLQEDLAEARQAESHKRKGELLKTVLHTIRPGADKVIATDYLTGEVFEIPLDPQLSPAANLESYFARYQKELRGVRMIQQQLEELEAARGELDVIEQRLDSAFKSRLPDLSALESIASQPKIRRLISRYSPRRKQARPQEKPAQKKEMSSRLLPKKYRTQDGLEIWVGRNDEGNDYLTTRLARGNDLFFHLDGYPGSHVVLRTEGRSDPSPRSLLDACELAVHFSKMKNAGSADVHVAPIKNVKKPKGAKPGLVFVRSGRTIHLRRDPKRLENILASRLD
jgi:predicted ribosome quality control (RQC) complex YloA/Tae2 family protein